MSETLTPLARRGVFRTAQGEGLLCGVPSVFVRLAGCSIACAGCDTDYRYGGSVTAGELCRLISAEMTGATKWLWVTGGEPTDHDLSGVLAAGRACGLRLALATAGTREVRSASSRGPWDFLSVSPHRLDSTWVQRHGEQLNVVPGLGLLRLEQLAGIDVSGFPEGARFITPLSDREGRLTNVRECLDFVYANAGWRLGFQAHKAWGVE